jgi:hypothetical protein
MNRVRWNRIQVALACVAVAAVLFPFPARMASAADRSIDFVAERSPGGAPSPNLADHPSPGVPHYFDLVFRETGQPQNEGLFSYDVGVRLVRPHPLQAGPDLRLLTGVAAVTIPPDNFVLPPTAEPATVSVIESDANHVIFNITSGSRDPNDLGSLGDINTGDKAARIWYVVDPGTPQATYRLRLDPTLTEFGSNHPNFPLEIPVDFGDEGVIVTPEPSAVALLPATALLALRRRRQ